MSTNDDHRYVPAHDGPASCTGCDWESRQNGIASTTQHDAHRDAVVTAADQTPAAEAHEYVTCTDRKCARPHFIGAEYVDPDLRAALTVPAIQTPATDSERVEQIRARVEVATPGPWKVDEVGEVVVPAPFDLHRFDLMDLRIAKVFERHADATFIAHAPEDVRYLLARLAEQAATIERVRGLRHDWFVALDSPEHTVLLEDVLDATDAALGSQRTEGQG